jgi:hypothetical protein
MFQTNIRDFMALGAQSQESRSHLTNANEQEDQLLANIFCLPLYTLRSWLRCRGLIDELAV